MIELSRLRYWLFLLLMVAMPMSYLPSIPLPLLNFPTFRIGLYQVLAVGFVLTCLPLLARNFPKFLKNRLFVVVLGLFSLTLLLGLFSSLVPVRSALYAASLVALIAFGCCGYLVWQKLDKKPRQNVIHGLLWSGVIFGVLGIFQLVLASFDRTALGTLCTGCSDAVFGFPRINLFSAEPQFFANSLIPAFFAGLIFRNNKTLANWSLGLSALAVTLTFSRGAFLAISAGLFVFILAQLAKKPFKARVLKPLLVIVVGSIVGFGLLIGSATLRYQNTPFITYNTTASMLEHLSMGTINLPLKAAASTTEASNENSFVPEGFIEASSNERLSAGELAIKAWSSTPLSLVFGVGMGNLGAYVNAHVQTVPSDLTVYIFYVLVLAELGLIGFLGLAGLLGFIVYRSLKIKSTGSSLFAGLTTAAFAVQLLFFGSYINVMYIYLLLGVFLAMIKPPEALPQK